MRNLKKFLALVLATMMLLSVAVISTSAAKKDYDYTDAAERLAALQVMKGNENGDLMLDSEVTRYQAALFFVQALTGETETATWQTTKNSAYFSDVVDYGTAIDYAYGINIVKGRGNGIYGYNDAIMYQDMLVMAVRALGYETADMSYPYGYILAAQKLGLTENVDKADYKAALTRGETAQIIWDMLDTQVAVVDPITDKLLYPGELGLTDALLEAGDVAPYQRPTLMEESELVIDKVIAYVTEFNEAEDDDEIDTVVVDFYGEEVEVAAADFGITAETPAVSYLGLPIDAYLDVKVEKFSQNEYDRDDAHILFTVLPTYEAVLNLGDGNVKLNVNEKDADRTSITFGDEKFTAGRYHFDVYTFGADGWTAQCADLTSPIFANFEYDNGEYVNANGNTFAQIQFVETDYYVWDADDEEWDTIVEVLYTPLSFGQYNVRELKDRANGSKLTDFATIAYYTADTYENYDEEDSNFAEVLVGSWKFGKETLTSGSKVTAATTSVSSSNGKNAKDLTLAGEDVKAGDFVFYAYNGLDNVLTVAKNCGTFETGRLTARNTNKETVKIGGTNYEFGFIGPAAVNGMPTLWDDYAADLHDDYIEELKAGMDNVKYIVADNRIVYMEPCEATTNNSVYDFVIISLDAERVADVLAISDAKYANNLSGTVDTVTDGYYIADNGYVAVAVLSKTTGAWELGYIKSVEANYNYYEEEFDNSYDIATLATYIDNFKTASDYKKYDSYVAAIDVITPAVGTDMLLAAVEVEDDNVYTVALPAYTYDLKNDDDEFIDEDGNVVNEANKVTVDGSFFVTGDFVNGKFVPENATVKVEGIIFSNNNNKTNAITADNEVEAERVTVDDETVIMVYDAVNGLAGARVGVQGEKNNYETKNGGFLAASADLIALIDLDGTEGIATWAEDVTSKNQTWYMRTADTSVEVDNIAENDDEELYSVTITNVIDMKTLEVIESVTIEVEDIDDELVLFATPACSFNVLHKSGNKIEVEKDALSVVVKDVANALDNNYKYVAVNSSAIEFVDADTISIAELESAAYDEDYKKASEAVEVVATVVTVNLIQDAEDYDYDLAVLAQKYVYNDGTEDVRDIWDIGSTDVIFGYTNGEPNEDTYWTYNIDGDMVEEINEPTDGILDSYIFAKDGAHLLVPELDNEDYNDAIDAYVKVYTAAAYDNGVVYLTVFKLITEWN